MRTKVLIGLPGRLRSQSSSVCLSASHVQPWPTVNTPQSRWQSSPRPCVFKRLKTSLYNPGVAAGLHHLSRLNIFIRPQTSARLPHLPITTQLRTSCHRCPSSLLISATSQDFLHGPFSTGRIRRHQRATQKFTVTKKPLKMSGFFFF